MTTILDDEWASVEAEALRFWDKIAVISPRCACVIHICKGYNDLVYEAGPPYRYS